MPMTQYVEKQWQGFKLLKNGSYQSAFCFSRTSLHGRKREGERKGDEILYTQSFVCGHPFSRSEILDLSSFFGVRLLTNSLSLSSNKAPIKPKVRVWSTGRPDFARKKWGAKSKRDKPPPSPSLPSPPLPLKKKK